MKGQRWLDILANLNINSSDLSETFKKKGYEVALICDPPFSIHFIKALHNLIHGRDIKTCLSTSKKCH